MGIRDLKFYTFLGIQKSFKWALHNIQEKSYRQETKQILRFSDFALFFNVLDFVAIFWTHINEFGIAWTFAIIIPHIDFLEKKMFALPGGIS